MSQSPGVALKQIPGVKVEPDSYGVLHVNFPAPTIVRYGKHATKLTEAYKGSLWGSKRYIRKWGVEIYDPTKVPEYKHTFRERDGEEVFEFIVTETKLFENRVEMKKFMASMPLSSFVINFLELEKQEKEAKKSRPKRIKPITNLLEYEIDNKVVKVTGTGTFEARSLLKALGMSWSGKAWEGKVKIKEIKALAQKGFVVQEKKTP
jgi:hypothetical protein